MHVLKKWMVMQKKKPITQIAHLAFLPTHRQPKELFSANARTEIKTKKVILET